MRMPTLIYMKTLSWFAVIVLVMILPSGSSARLGETPEQCEERYGTPVAEDEMVDFHMPGALAVSYQKAGLTIYIAFINGTAGQIQYEKSQKNALGIAEEMSDAEILSLLQANSGGGEWNERDLSASLRRGKLWVLDGKLAYAVYGMSDNVLVFQNVAFHHKREANKEAAEVKNLDGF